VDPSRVERYLDKLDHARERLGLVQAWTPKARTEAHWRLATYKAFQEAAEAIGDLVAMAVVDSGHPAKDDYRNVDLAVEEDALAPRLADPLAEATGLRNRLVHEYETLDDEIALESVEQLVEPMLEALAEVETWLDSRR
jgi:uncharacterized protein YutE (UPF0331/DUF86 family)